MPITQTNVIDTNAPMGGEAGITPNTETAADIGLKTGTEDIQLGASANVGGFFVGDNLGISASSGHITGELSTKLTKFYKGALNTRTPLLLTLDNTQIPDLAYSTIVVAIPGEKAGEALYSTAIIEASGLESGLTTQEYLLRKEEANNKKTPLRIYTAGDNLEDTLRARIEAAIVRNLPVDVPLTKFICLDGIVVPPVNEVTDVMAAQLGKELYDVLVYESAARAGKIKTLNIPFALGIKDAKGTVIPVNERKNKTKLKNIITASTPGVVKADGSIGGTKVDYLGVPKRADWESKLVTVKTGTGGYQNVHDKNGNAALATTTGFIDFYPVVETVNGMNGPVDVARFCPAPVITDIDLSQKTLGHAMLAIATASIVKEDRFWLGVASPTADNKEHQPGALNIIANIENNPTGLGEPVDLTSTELTTDDVLRGMKDIAPKAGVISMIVKSFGTNTGVTGIFAVASRTPLNSEQAIVRAKARQHIINTVSEMSGLVFNFPIDKIFNGDSVVIPTGAFYDANNEPRDFLEIDSAYVGNTTGNPDLMKRWAGTLTPNAGEDAYAARVDILNAIGNAASSTAIINGKADLIHFSREFTEALYIHLKACGLAFDSDPLVAFNGQVDFQTLGKVFALGAGQNSAFNYANQGAGGNDFQTYSTYMGASRF